MKIHILPSIDKVNKDLERKILIAGNACLKACGLAKSKIHLKHISCFVYINLKMTLSTIHWNMKMLRGRSDREKKQKKDEGVLM